MAFPQTVDNEQPHLAVAHFGDLRRAGGHNPGILGKKYI